MRPKLAGMLSKEYLVFWISMRAWDRVGRRMSSIKGVEREKKEGEEGSVCVMTITGGVVMLLLFVGLVVSRRVICLLKSRRTGSTSI